MAVLTASNATVEWSTGSSERTAVIALKKVTTGDTLDLNSPTAIQLFSVVKRAVAVGTTVAGQATLTVAGTTITMPAGLTDDAAYALVYGCAL